MAEFKLVAEIGGVDTSDPERAFSPDEQKAVLEAMLGASAPEGALVTPYR